MDLSRGCLKRAASIVVDTSYQNWQTDYTFLILTSVSRDDPTPPANEPVTSKVITGAAPAATRIYCALAAALGDTHLHRGTQGSTAGLIRHQAGVCTAGRQSQAL